MHRVLAERDLRRLACGRSGTCEVSIQRCSKCSSADTARVFTNWLAASITARSFPTGPQNPYPPKTHLSVTCFWQKRSQPYADLRKEFGLRRGRIADCA